MTNLNNFLANLHYLNHPYLSGLSALFVLLMGIFVLSKDKESVIYKVFFWMTLVLGVWFFSNTLSMLYFNDFASSFFWYKVGYTAVPFICATYYHFYLVYFKKQKTALFFIIYAICILEIFVHWFYNGAGIRAYALPNVGIIFQERQPYSYFLIFGMVKYFIISLIVALLFLNEYRKETAAVQKQQLKYLTIIFFLTIIGVVEWLVAFNIPIHLAWVLMFIFVSFVAYSILRYRLLDIKVVIKRGLIYSSIIALVSGIIFGISFLNSWLADHIQGFKVWMIPLISGVVAFIIGRIFWNKSKEIDKLKYQFITVAAHKLRTPLTDIKWAAASLKDAKISNRDKDKLTKEIISANERLIDLTNELLTITKAEAGRYQYNFELTDLEKVVRKVVNNFQLQMREKGVKLIYSAEKDLPKVKIDPARISSVAQTLMENAILYTKNEIKINIDVYRNSLIFHIEDNGIGIPKEDQPYIFSKFYRTHDAYLTETEGTGLGLFLAKSIIEKHKGKIGARSEGRGKGSIFWFSLPF